MCKKYEGFGPPRIIEVNDSEAEGVSKKHKGSRQND